MKFGSVWELFVWFVMLAKAKHTSWQCAMPAEDGEPVVLALLVAFVVLRVLAVVLLVLLSEADCEGCDPRHADTHSVSLLTGCVLLARVAPPNEMFDVVFVELVTKALVEVVVVIVVIFPHMA
jgi:hypothetical protein